jgi:hypothetical protein
MPPRVRSMYSRTRARAAAGAGLLDRVVPGWWRLIKLRPLDIGDGCYCVTGQLFGSYSEGLTRLDMTDEEAGLYGFNRRDGDWGGFPTLTSAWKDEVRHRKQGARAGRQVS